MSYEHESSHQKRTRRIGHGLGRRRTVGIEKLPPLPSAPTVGNGMVGNMGSNAISGYQSVSAESLCHFLVTDAAHTVIVDARPRETRGPGTIRLAWSPPIWDPICAPNGNESNNVNGSMKDILGGHYWNDDRRRPSQSIPQQPRPQDILNYAKRAISLLCAGADDYMHPGHKLSTKRVIFFDEHGLDSGPARIMASLFADMRSSFNGGIFGSSSNLASGGGREVMFLRGGLQTIMGRFPGICINAEMGTGSMTAIAAAKTGSSDKLNQTDPAQQPLPPEDQPWLYSEILAGLNDDVVDSSLADVLRKRMAIQMAIMSMLTNPTPIDDPPRLVLNHVPIEYLNGASRKDELQRTKTVTTQNAFLYLGSQESAKPKHLKALNINHVIRLGNCRWPYPACPGVVFHDFSVDDLPTARISSLFPATTAILDGIRTKGERVLVHCQAGVSRSASIVISFILRRGTMGMATTVGPHFRPKPPANMNGDPSSSILPGATTLREAFQVVYASRPIICPNVGFWMELEQYERVLSMANSNILNGASFATAGNQMQIPGQASSLPYFWMIQFHSLLDLEYRSRMALVRQQLEGRGDMSSLHWDEAQKMFYRFNANTQVFEWVHPSSLVSRVPPPTFIVPLGPPSTVVVDYSTLQSLTGGAMDQDTIATAVGAFYLQNVK
ncbi:hypothetical protein HDU97_003651 [Phlyctochytrium planicorne]|nr:hypothetical protein HDU97_003651 [Phlyctochytrium planicorne]